MPGIVISERFYVVDFHNFVIYEIDGQLRKMKCRYPFDNIAQMFAFMMDRQGVSKNLPLFFKQLHIVKPDGFLEREAFKKRHKLSDVALQARVLRRTVLKISVGGKPFYRKVRHPKYAPRKVKKNNPSESARQDEVGRPHNEISENGG